MQDALDVHLLHDHESPTQVKSLVLFFPKPLEVTSIKLRLQEFEVHSVVSRNNSPSFMSIASDAIDLKMQVQICHDLRHRGMSRI